MAVRPFGWFVVSGTVTFTRRIDTRDREALTPFSDARQDTFVAFNLNICFVFICKLISVHSVRLSHLPTALFARLCRGQVDDVA